MSHVDPAPKPPDFDHKVREPGLRAIAELIGEVPEFPRAAGHPFTKVAEHRQDIPSGKLPTYWTKALDDLMRAYKSICAYSCFRIHPVTGSRSVDHMAPRSRRWDQVYEWTNYRLASSLLNARKRDFTDVIDPFEVQNGWFEMEFVGFQVKPAAGLDAGTARLVEGTISRLGLNDRSFWTSRERDAELYWSEAIGYAVLMEESPFVAMELRRHGRLLEGDA